MRLLIAIAVVCTIGCTRREGMNFECVWPSDPAFAVDLQNTADLRHLLDDIRVAEELEIRYGDQMAGRRPVSVLGMVVRRGMGTTLSLAQRMRQRVHHDFAQDDRGDTRRYD